MSAFAETPLLRTYRETTELSDAEFAEKRQFEITCHVIAVYANDTVLACDSGECFEVLFPRPSGAVPGQVAVLRGHTLYKIDTSQVRDLVGEKAETINYPPTHTCAPKHETVSGLLRSNSTCFVSVRGTITDAFVDDIDSEWNYMILQDGADVISVALLDGGDLRNRLAGFVGAEVELTGAAFPGHAGFRIFLGPFVKLWSEECIRIIRPAPQDPFSLPGLDDIRDTSPARLASLGRRTAVGDVIAVWGSGNVLLREDGGRIVHVSLANPHDHPSAGDRVSAVGYPETDLFRINLSRARFRPEKPSGHADAAPETVTPKALLLDEQGKQMIKPNYHGRLVRMTGIVRALPAEAGENRIVYIECGKFLVPVDVSAKPEIADGLEIGCRIEATGVCVLESPNWRPNMVFPRIDRLVLVPRREDDIAVISRPPWWTTGRLMAFIGALIAALVAILVWNLALRRLAERRGRELFRSEISKAAAELRIDERTRLAAELHDAIAQNLTGVSMQIAAARSAHTAAPKEVERHLSTADQMLRSSRVELRRCIWDLRSEALDIPNFGEAIRVTVQPAAGKAALHVKCKIPRSKLSDSTAHALLRIVRELASNAVAHGGATEVFVECRDCGKAAQISVRDNGSGFDPESCPGEREGHFGLKGIKERVKHLGGTFAISSEPGIGTKATIVIRIN